MTDQRVGAAFRAVRLRRGWRQRDVAARAGVSPALVSLIERGHIATLSVETLRRIGSELEVRIDLVARWRGGELDRLVNSGHSALAEAITKWLRSEGWTVAPEVSFAIYRESGIIDLLAWHAATRTLLVLELKTLIVDVNDLVGVTDRKTRLAMRIGDDRGWSAATVATLVVVADVFRRTPRYLRARTRSTAAPSALGFGAPPDRCPASCSTRTPLPVALSRKSAGGRG